MKLFNNLFNSSDAPVVLIQSTLKTVYTSRINYLTRQTIPLITNSVAETIRQHIQPHPIFAQLLRMPPRNSLIEAQVGLIFVQLAVTANVVHNYKLEFLLDA